MNVGAVKPPSSIYRSRFNGRNYVTVHEEQRDSEMFVMETIIANKKTYIQIG